MASGVARLHTCRMFGYACACLNPECDPLGPAALPSWVSVYLRPILSLPLSLSLSLSLLSPSTLSVLWAVCCGAVTSLSPRCHPAGAGFRRAWPLPKPHSATSAIHKRQPLSLSYSLAHTASDSHTPPFRSLSLSPTKFFILISKFYASPRFCIPSTASSHHFWFYSC